MDIYVKTQATATINLIVPLMINTGAPDTGATVTCKAILPDGTEATFTAPTISEVIASSGVYKLIFPSDAATKLFSLTNEYNPYTVLVKSATSGSTGYRAIRVYCVDRLPGELAKSTEVDALPTLAEIEASTVLAMDATTASQTSVDALPTLAEIEASTLLTALPTLAEIEASTLLLALPTLAEIEASTVLATVSDIAAIDTLIDGVVTTVNALPTLAEIEASTVLAKEATIPTLAEIEASTILAKEASITFLTKCIRNKKKVKVVSGVLYLIIYDDDNTTEILRKAIKDVDGADVADPAAGVIAFETKSTV